MPSFSDLLYVLAKLAEAFACIYFLITQRERGIYREFAFCWFLLQLTDLVIFVAVLIVPWDTISGYFLITMSSTYAMLLFGLRLLSGIVRIRNRNVLTLIYILVVLFDIIFHRGYDRFNQGILIIGGLTTFILCLLVLYQLWKKSEENTTYGLPSFWICIGFACYWGVATPFASLTSNHAFNGTRNLVDYELFVLALVETVLSLSIIKTFQCKMSIHRK